MDAPTRKVRPMTGVARAELRERARIAYEGGASVREAAAGIERGYSTTHMLLGEAGVVFRSRGGQPRKKG
jgi:transposase